MSSKVTHKFTAAEIDHALRRFFTVRQYLYHLSNKYLFSDIQGGWESDFVTMIRKSQYFSEVEIKVSKADFYKDFEKPKHKILTQVHSKGWAVEGLTPLRWQEENDILQHLLTCDLRVSKPHSKIKVHHKSKLLLPHRFYFCFPEGMVPMEDVPKYAGVLVARTGYFRYGMEGATIREVRKAPMLHKTKIFDHLKQDLLEKFFYETFNTREKESGKYLRKTDNKNR